MLHGLRRLGGGSEFRVERPLLPRRRIPPRRAGLFRRARGFAGARQTMVRHGTFHFGGAVETSEHPQTQRGNGARLPSPRGHGRRRHQLLPMACIRIRRRSVPFRHGSARRREHETVPSGMRTGRDVASARRCRCPRKRIGACGHGDPFQRRIGVGHPLRDVAEHETQPLA